MTLEYLWIEDYRCIQRQGFNFGGALLGYLANDNDMKKAEE
ncbi:MAG: hypothetical protein RBR51_05000 [Candidatus Cloacimonadaceae bacterium]|nr:hypothetical protein [Candidatus Cloacimonadaceae bacterium]